MEADGQMSMQPRKNPAGARGTSASLKRLPQRALWDDNQESTMNTNDGGPAFPQGQAVGDISKLEGGMSLRDYFAAKAMQGIFSASADMEDYPNRERVAAMAYAQADAMLAARES